MHKLPSLKYSLFIILFLILAGVGATKYFEPLVVGEMDQRLAMAPFGYNFNGHPFTGLVYSLHPNGKLARLISVWRGRLNGKDYQWYSTGQLFVERNYWDGVEHGEQKIWHASGEPYTYSFYEHGVRRGESWGWHTDGSVKAFSLHRAGHEVAIKRFSAKHKPHHNYFKMNGQVYGIKGDRLCDRNPFFSR